MSIKKNHVESLSHNLSPADLAICQSTDEQPTQKQVSIKHRKMKMHFAFLLGLLVACCCWVSAFAQESSISEEMQLSQEAPKGRFVVRAPQLHVVQTEAEAKIALATAALPTWNGSFSSGGQTFTYNMVGTAPSTNVSTTIQAVIVPIKIVITRRGKTTTFDPAHVLSNGRTVTQNTVVSPIFDATTTYVQGTVNVGKTQYIDAYQRANFWGTVQHDTNYHLLLGGPTVLAEQTLSPPSSAATTGSPFGFTAGLVDINWFDGQLQSLMSRLD